ncbi:MAG: aquaporin Z [Chloroflexota bacterium]|nr:aquaporin Z [Chloroflexota bacterium]
MRRYSAELLGTFVLVFGGVGSAVLAGDKIGALGVALAFGLSLLAMVYVIGPISGCHINPAVTVGALLTRKLDARHAAGYIIAQVVGALLAAGVLLLVAKGAAGGYDPSAAGFGANGYDEHSPGHYGLAAAFVVEVVLTAFLVLTVLGATDVAAPVGFAGLPIGLVLTLIHLVGIPITNTSVNPARSIGPAVFVGGWALAQLWLFIIAPLIGAVVGAGIYLAIRAPSTEITMKEAEQALESEQAERQVRGNQPSSPVIRDV